MTTLWDQGGVCLLAYRFVTRPYRSVRSKSRAGYCSPGNSWGEDRISFQQAGPFVPRDLSFGVRASGDLSHDPSRIEVFDVDAVVLLGGIDDPVGDLDGLPGVVPSLWIC